MIAAGDEMAFTSLFNHWHQRLGAYARERVRNAEWISFSAITTEQTEMEEFFSVIDEAVEKLPPQQQRAWLLSRRDGLMYEEVAHQMQLSRETVKRHIQLSIRFITNYVKQHAELHTATAAVLYKRLALFKMSLTLPAIQGKNCR